MTLGAGQMKAATLTHKRRRISPVNCPCAGWVWRVQGLASEGWGEGRRKVEWDRERAEGEQPMGRVVWGGRKNQDLAIRPDPNPLPRAVP